MAVTTLTVATDTDFSAINPPLNGVDTITFSNLAAPATASFAASQFNGTAIARNAVFIGSSAENKVQVNLASGALDASQWTFSNWTDGQDGVTFKSADFNGLDLDDTVIGTSRDDYFNTGFGFDNLFGGLGNDTFFVEDYVTNLHYGSINGGAGSGDTLIASGRVNFIGRVTITGIERLAVEGEVDISGDAFGAGGITEVVGNATYQRLVIAASPGASLDLSGVTFTNWTNVPFTPDSFFYLNVVGGDVIGSSEDDRIFGTIGNDALRGGGGNDLIQGGNGDDIMAGGSGNDLIYGYDELILGDTGSDTVDYSGAGSGIVIDLRVAVQAGTGGLGTDEIYGIENIIGGAFDDVLTGSGDANVLRGGNGNDNIFGGTGSDTIDYQDAGSGIYIDLRVSVQAGTGGLGTDVIDGFENIIGGAFDDFLTGNDLANDLRGGEGADQLYGLAGSDTLRGGNGDDYINAGDGNDTVFGGDGNDVISGGAGGTDTLNGEAGADFITGEGGVDIIDGGAGDDIWLGGGDGDDVITGGAGLDRIDGGAGNDNLTGGTGRDYLSGGLGSDRFVFNVADFQAFIIDTVGDFHSVPGTDFDAIRLQGSALDYSFSDVNGCARIEHIATLGVIYVYNFTVAQLEDQTEYFI